MKNRRQSLAGGLKHGILFYEQKLLCATKLEKILQKTAESCGNLNFLTTFAKRLKIKELWQK